MQTVKNLLKLRCQTVHPFESAYESYMQNKKADFKNI